jgi:hypothetical protein
MEDYFAAQAIAIAAGRKYAQSEASEKIRSKGVVKKKEALAHNRAVQMTVHGFWDNDIHLMRAIATCNPKLVETREMATKYIKRVGGQEHFRRRCVGVWALRRHGGMVAQ